MKVHRPGRDRSGIARILGCGLVLILSSVSGCTRSAEPAEPVKPVSSTIDISEPVVIVNDDGNDQSDGGVTLSDAKPTEAVQSGGDIAAKPAENVTDLPDDRVSDLLSTVPDSTPAPNTAPDEGVPADEPAGETPSFAPPSSVPLDAASLPELTLADETAVEADSETALEVVQTSPVGDVEIAPYVTITFNQAMVTTGTTDAASVPIELSPAVGGGWRWLGDRTLRFEPTNAPDGGVPRLPDATAFEVTIGGGISALNGRQLGDDLTWNFTTPPPKVVGMVGAAADQADPTQVGSSPVFVARTDQHVTATALAAVTTLMVNGEAVQVRPASDTEIESRQDASDAVDSVGPQRSPAITPVERLPADASIAITIGPDLESAEGDLRQPDSATFFAQTRSAPRIESTSCSSEDCAAGTSLQILFNNSIDTAKYTRAELADLITVTPSIPNLSIEVRSKRIELIGDTAAETEYRVTIGAGLTDVYGQTLGEDSEAKFKVGNAHSFFNGPRSEMVILDPDAAQPTLAVQTVNHDRLHVRVWAVTTRDYQSYQLLRSEGERNAQIEAPTTWLQLADETVSIANVPNQLVTTEIDLDEALDSAGSQVVVSISPDPAVAPDQSDFANNRPLWAWVQRTSLAVDAIADESTLMIWTTDLTTGKPVGGIPVSLIGDSRVATTDDEGLRVIKLTDQPIEGLIANDGRTVTYLPAPDAEGWKVSQATQQDRWDVVLDGTEHRPGETVRFTGWVRGLDPQSDRLLHTPPTDSKVTYTVTDSAGIPLATGSVTTNELGGFTGQVELPADAETGTAKVVLSDATSSTTSEFSIEEYETPNFDVAVQASTNGPYLAGTPVALNASAHYSNRLPLTGAPVSWEVETQPTRYVPPNWSDFEFGRAPNPANGRLTPDQGDCADCDTAPTTKDYAGTTDGTGSQRLSIEMNADLGFARIVRATATITDDTGSSSTAEDAIVIHPAENYVGIRTSDQFTELGNPIRVDAVVTDLDGRPVVGRPVTVEFQKVVSNWKNGEWIRTIDPVDSCEFESVEPGSDASSMGCTFAADTGGEYTITATVVDRQGRQSTSELTHWVSGSLALPSTQTQLEQATVIPDKDHYEPGETARLLIGAPWAPARGVVALSRYNIEETIPFETEDGSVIVEVPITDRSIPNITGWVTMIGQAPRLNSAGQIVPGENRPAVASGRINLAVPATTRKLDVTTQAATSTVRPGETTSITVDVHDQQGAPISGAQVAVFVANESVLANSGFEISDPMDVFYADYSGDLSGISSRQYVQLLDTRRVDPDPAVADSGDVTGQTPTDQSAQPDDPGATDGSTDRRDRFAPLSLYSTDNLTNEDGTVAVDFRAPATTGNYRITAVVIGPDQRFGLGESNIATGQPIEVEPQAPEHVRVGDHFELPVILRNNTAADLTIETGIETTAGLPIDGAAGQSTTVTARDSVEIRFSLDATEVGPGEIRIVSEPTSAGDPVSVEARASIDVLAAAGVDTAISYSVIPATPDGASAVQSIATTAPDQQMLDVSLSTAPESNLADIIDRSKPADLLYSNSARASAVLTGVASRRWLDALGHSDSPNGTIANARQALNLLIRAQREDGAWGEWRRSPDADPWVTVLATDAVLRGVDAGWASISDDARHNALRYLSDIQAHIPENYTVTSRTLIRAYAAAVLLRAGGDYPAIGRQRAGEIAVEFGPYIEPDAAALIWPALPAPQRSVLDEVIASRLTLDDPSVTFASTYGTDDFVVDWSQTRTDAIVLAALGSSGANPALVNVAMEHFLAERTDGTWGNDQADAFAAQAVNALAVTVAAKQPPDDLDAKAWIGDRWVAAQRFVGTDPPVANGETTSSSLDADGAELVVSARGNGRLFVRSAVIERRSELAPPQPNGIVVERSYEPIADPGDVIQRADGTWLIKRGAPVRVRLVMVTAETHTNVVLTDPLAAGTVALTPSLTVAQPGRTDSASDQPESDAVDDAFRGDYRYWPGWNWFEFQRVNDREAQAATSVLPAGSYEYIYATQATTPGAYTVPESIAHARFEPDVFGSSGADRVVIE